MKTNRLLITSVIALLGLTACGSPAKSKQEESKDSAPTSAESQIDQSSDEGGKTSEGGSGDIFDTPTEITIWTTYNDTYQTIINNCIEEFEGMYKNVKVNNVKQQGSYDDLKKMCVDGFAVDNYPDIVSAYPDSVADFLNNGKGLDMTPYMEDKDIGWSEDDFDDIPENIIAAGQNYSIPGTYSLPCSKSTEAMYYNQDVLIGLDLSSIDATINKGMPLNDSYFQNMTWEELFDKLVPALDAYDKAQPEDKKIIDRTTYADWAWVGYDSDDNLFITLAEQYGYDYTGIDQVTGKGQILFDNAGMKGLMKKFAGYNANHYFTTKGVIKQNVNYRSTVDAMLFSIGSTGGVKYQFSSDNPHNVGVAPIPHAEGKPYRVISQGPDFAFLDHNSEAKAKATWLFYKLFTNTKYNSAWALTTGYSPIRYSVMETKEYINYADASSQDPKTLDRLYALNASYAARAAQYFFTSPVFKGSSEARNQVATIYAACVTAGSDLDNQIDSIFATAVANTKLKM